MKTMALSIQATSRYSPLAAAAVLTVLVAGHALASVATWTGAQSPDWYDSRNWSPASVPGAGADVVINGGYASASGNNLSFNTLTVNGGTLTDIAALNVQVITVAGTVATTNLATTTLNLKGGTVFGSIQMTAGGTWNGGTLNGGPIQIPNGGIVSIPSGSVRLGDSVQLINGGTVQMTGGHIEGYQFSTILNQAGASFILATDGVPFSQYFAGNTFQNNGLFRKSAGAGTATVNVWTFHQYGSIQCDAGAIEFQSLTQLHSGSLISGSASVLLNGDTRIDGAVRETIANLRMIGGGLSCSDPSSLVGRLDWEAGTISGVLGVPVGSLLAVSGTGLKRLANASSINVGGTYRWDGPTGVEGYQYSTITVLASGLCDLTADGDPFDNYFAGNELVIDGTLRKSAGSGGTTVLNDWTYRHRGTLDCAVSTLEIAGSLVLENSSSVTGTGQVLISGTTFHNGGVNLTAPVTWSGGTWVGGGGTMTGLLTWSGGSSSGSWTVASTGTLRVNHGAGALKRLNDAAVIETAGTIELLSGTLNGYQNSIIRVLSGGIFRCLGDSVMDQYFSGSRIDIHAGGSLTTLAASHTQIDWAVNNAGSVTTPAGILYCNGGGTSTGLFQSTPPGALYFTSGVHSLAAGSEMRGPGDIRLTGGTLNATASVPCFVRIEGGTAQGTGDVGEFQFRDGSQWTRGFIGGHSRILGGATLTVSGPNTSLRRINDSARLDIDGRLLWLGPGSIELYQLCQLAVNDAGILDLTGDGSVFSQYFSGNALTSTGTIRRSTSTGDAVLASATYSSSGRIDAQAGRLVFDATLNLGHGGVVAGAGRTVIAGGTTTLAGTTTLSSTLFELGGGTLFAAPAANGTLAGSTIEWTSGYVAGLVKWTGIARTTGSGFRRINDSSELRNAGVLTLTDEGSTQLYQNSTLHNLQGATLNATGQVSLSYYFGGNLLLNEGTLVLGTPPGRMIVEAAFTQTATGRLEIGIAGSSAVVPQFDILNVSGTATLGGTLVAHVENAYNPSIGTSFEILTGSPRLGTFAIVVAPRFTVTYPTAGDPPVSLNDVLLVAHAATTESYAAWASTRGLTGNDAAATADPDGDGLINWLEFAFNLNPKAGNERPVAASVERIGGESWLVMRYRRWAGPVDAGILYQPEASRDLAAWSSSGIIDEFDSNATPVSTSEPRRCRILTSESKKFLRLHLISP